MRASLTGDKFAADRILTRAFEADLDGLFSAFTMANLAGRVLAYACGNEAQAVAPRRGVGCAGGREMEVRRAKAHGRGRWVFVCGQEKAEHHHSPRSATSAAHVADVTFRAGGCTTDALQTDGIDDCWNSSPTG